VPLSSGRSTTRATILKLNLELLLPFAFGFYLERREGRIKQHTRTHYRPNRGENVEPPTTSPARRELIPLPFFSSVPLSPRLPSPFFSTDKSFKGFHTISTGTKLVQYLITTESFPLVSQEFHFMVLRSAPSRHFQVV